MRTRSTLVALLLLTLSVLLAILLRSTPESESPVPPQNCSPTPVMMANSAEGREFTSLKDLPDFPGSAGRVSISGFVLTSSCKPAPGTQVRFWATRENGEYTDQSYSSVVSDESGRYEFSLPMPLAYPGSDVPPHVHVAATIDGQVIMTEVRSLKKDGGVSLDLVPELDTSTTPPEGGADLP